jgi:quercetin dioxygenase-like cupin family protein
MKVIRRDEAVGPGPDGDLERFTGHVSHLRLWAPPADAQSSNVSVVRFDRGVRGSWHTHSGGQLIHVLEGEGVIGLRGADPVRLGPGDSVALEPGEEHWHGTAPGAELAHMAISYGSLTWLEGPEC